MIRIDGIEFNEDDATLTLLIARRAGRSVAGGKINVAQDALAAMRNSVAESFRALEGLQARRYDPDAQLEDDQYFTLDRNELEDSMGVLALLDRGPQAELLDIGQMRERPVLFYAIIVGQDANNTVAFVTKSNPARVAQRGHVLTPSGNVLTRIETPVFLFEDRIDLVVDHERLIIRNQLAFEQWFRDTPALIDKVGDWIGGITAHLPIDGDGAQRLKARAKDNSRLRRVLYVIQKRGHLEHVPMSRIRSHVAAQGLDAATLIRGNKLVFDEADPALLLKLLNEDLFKGGLTDEAFIVDRKSARS